MNYYYIFGVIAIVYILNIFLNRDWPKLSLGYIGCMSKTSKSKKIKMPKMEDIMAQIKADQLKKADRVKYHANLLFDTLAQTKVSSI